MLRSFRCQLGLSVVLDAPTKVDLVLDLGVLRTLPSSLLVSLQEVMNFSKVIHSLGCQAKCLTLSYKSADGSEESIQNP